MSHNDEGKLLGDVGQRIRACRVAQGLTLDEFARLSGISAPALSRIETGKRDPRLTTLARIAAGLRVSPIDFLDDHRSDKVASTKTSGEGYDLGDYW